MTKKNALLIIVALAALAAGWYFMNKKPTAGPVTTTDTATETTRATYVSMDGSSVVVEYTGDTAILRSDKLGVSRFDIAVSASGARYVSADGALVLWNKGDDLTISRGDTELFVGTKPPERGEESALTTTWVWVSTEGKTNIVPNEKDAFTISLGAKEDVSGTTDCNSFSGAYDIFTDGSFTFGPLASTKMFCEGAQESEYFEMLRRVTSYAVSNDELVLVIADEESHMTFKKK